MPDLQSLLDELREVLDGKVVECKHDKVQAWDIPGVSDRCPDCEGEDHIPNPAYDGLREVVREKQWHGDHYETVPRSWEGMPIGALEGSLRWNLPPGWRLSVTGDKSFQATLDAGSRRFITTYWETPDLASAQAVLEALEIER